MKCKVVVFPGSNCDYDCYYVMKSVFNISVEYVWHKDTVLGACDFLILPGGFSYGDYLRCGSIARFSPIMKEVVAYAKKGNPVIGICNGFQVLLESGLLPGAMLRNKTLRFICKDVYLKTLNHATIFSSAIARDSVLQIPIAHGEGNYYCDDDTLKRLHDSEQILFQYASKDMRIDESTNPNGSRDNIAGIINATGNVLGMMPHPERASENILGSHDGTYIFQSIINSLA
jgi:phosphoribosylformylglycinamidine synthase subunit PurQ / glutaminase